VAEPVRRHRINDIATKYVPQPEVSQQPQPHFMQSSVRAEKREQVPSVPKTARRSGYSKVKIALVSMAVILFLFGIGMAFLQFRSNQQALSQVSQVAGDNDNNSQPDETKPADIGSYVVSPGLPRFLSIPQIDVHARVRRVGIDVSNQMQAPSNIYDVGWYEDSAKPGDTGGAILIDGHVHGPTQPGIFYDLKKLRNGDEIQLERGDGEKFRFRVAVLESYDADKVDMAAALVSIEPGKLGLNLITCDGPLVSSGNDYAKRLIVFAVEI
jgi:LPXTG-site transpeptidase (sortase) family protein